MAQKNSSQIMFKLDHGYMTNKEGEASFSSLKRLISAKKNSKTHALAYIAAYKSKIVIITQIINSGLHLKGLNHCTAGNGTLPQIS